MAQNSKIEWTNHTVNLWWGCTKVHSGCDNCYAEAQANRFGNDVWGNDRPRRVIKSAFNDLEKYQNLAVKAGEVHRVFVGSMMDIFEKPMPLIDNSETRPGLNIGGVTVCMHTGHLRDALFNRISDGRYPNLMFLLLTKRPSNINKYIPENWKIIPPENVMFGTSPVDAETFNTLVLQLSEVKGKKFLSIEPQLDDIDLLIMERKWNTVTHPWRGRVILSNIDWIIQGGESGPNKRPFNLDWAYRMKEQCVAYGIPYFFKQIDKVLPIPNDLLTRQLYNHHYQ